MKLAAHRGRTLLVRKSPVDRGNFKNAWRVRTIAGGAEIQNDAPYAGIIELGARPHPVSREGIEALTGWARRHFPGVDEKEHKSIAFAIAAKLKKYGQKPTYLVRDSMDELRQYIGEAMEAEVKKFAANRTKGGK